ncbi:MAG: TIGR03905 family TSCPD domain-containing protein [Christensenellales bacterium]|jgi:uncharacterized protein (TIGR03905 family)
MYRYQTRGTCASAIEIETQGDVVKSVRFVDGCRGNTQGLAALAAGMRLEDVIARCKGIKCRGETSCPDQLARALEMLAEHAKELD